MMKFTFLGTAAAEGIPFPFCDCFTCEHARNHGGRNIRKRQTLLINDDLLIDIGPDLYASCAQLGISLVGLNYLLVTHSHGDHFHPHNLEMRAKMFRLATELPELTVVAGPSVWALWGRDDKAAAMHRVPLLPGNRIELAPYKIRSIPASHHPSVGDAMNYIVDDGRSKLLFASDTGIYSDEVWALLAGERFDAVVMEATLGNRQQGRNHLSFDDYEAMLGKLRESGAVTAETRLFATHFSHQCVEPHEDIEAHFRGIGVVCAYDGLTVSLNSATL